MTAEGERIAAELATLKVFAENNARRIARLEDEIHGGQSVDYEHSIRGRLHVMAGNQATAEKLAAAADAVRREAEKTRKSRLTGWQWLYLAVCATAAAAAPYVVLLTHG